MVQSLLDLPTTDDSAEVPSKIRAEGNSRSEDADKLRSTPYNSDTSLPYNRPLMKVYKTTSSEFSTVAPKC